MPTARPYLDEVACFDTRDPQWKDRLLSILGTKVCPDTADVLPVIEAVIDHAHNLGANWIVAEPYISQDWADEYSSWYSLTFRAIPRVTTRLHFFGLDDGRRGPASEEEMISNLMVLPDLLESHRAEYVGYTLIRPFQTAEASGLYFPTPPVGETVLRYPGEFVGRDGESTSASSLIGKKRPGPPRCHAKFHTHLLGFTLETDGFPFIQQDQTVSVCVHSSMWMIARYLHARGEARRFHPSEMEVSARDVFPLGIAREGLESDRVYAAMDQMGMNPLRVVPKSPGDGLSLISAYVASGIPVIASVGSATRSVPNHAIALTGFEYGREPKTWGKLDVPAGLAPGLVPASSYISNVIAHDDSRGPYQRLVTDFRKGGNLEGHDRLKLGEYIVYQFLIPVPDRIHLTVDDVRLHTNNWFQRVLTRQDCFEGIENPWSSRDWTGLVLRAYLRRGHAFKREALRVAQDLAKEKGEIFGLEWYWRQRFPSQLWVVELSRGNTDFSDESKHRLVGEMLFDATAHFADYENSLLSFRLDGRMVFRDHRRRREAPESSAYEWPVRTKDTRKWIPVDGLTREAYGPYIAIPSVPG